MASKTVSEVRVLAGERCVVEFGDGSSVKTTLAVAADMSLHAGKVLDGEALEALSDAVLQAQCNERSEQILSCAACSERALYDKLVAKGFPQHCAAESVARLKRLGLIDDASYAALVARHYAARGYGERKIRDELYRRKVPREMWDGALADYETDGETVDRLLRQKLNGGDPHDRARLKRATDALLRRGYSWEDVRGAVARLKFSDSED